MKYQQKNVTKNLEDGANLR